MDFTPAHPALARALAARGYASPTAVQAAMFAPEVAGRDLLVSAQTGSGKTVAFGLAMAAELYGEGETLPRPGAPLALIVAPTRELAIQVRRELSWLYAGARVAQAVGGTSVRMEQRALDAGCHIVVGTPGRLCDHLSQGALDLSALRVLVLDEADEMLDMGFREELETILAAAPANRRTLFYSATIPDGIERLCHTFLKSPLRISASPQAQAHADIEYRAVTVLAHEREAAIVNVLRYVDPPGALVFAATREGVEHLRARLVERGFAAVALSGDLTQNERNRALDALRNRTARVLVATDVAARGLDLPELALVIQADLPLDASVFQHRSGRTGRAGRKGVSVVLVPPQRRRHADRLFREAGIHPTWSRVPTVEAIEKLDQARIATSVGELAGELEEPDRAGATALLEKHSAEDLAAVLHRILQARLPSPEELPETAAFLDRLHHPQIHTGPPDAYARRPGPPPPRGGGVWFVLNIGRDRQADPKWLIPLLCRRGRITKSDIGAIRIGPTETQVEIRPAVAGKFAALTGRSADEGISIIPA